MKPSTGLKTQLTDAQGLPGAFFMPVWFPYARCGQGCTKRVETGFGAHVDRTDGHITGAYDGVHHAGQERCRDIPGHHFKRCLA